MVAATAPKPAKAAFFEALLPVCGKVFWAEALAECALLSAADSAFN